MHAISCFARKGKLVYASFRLFHGLREEWPSSRRPYHYTQLLQTCSSPQRLKQIHAQIIAMGYDRNPFLATSLVGQYTRLSGSAGIDHARILFDDVSERDVFLWNVMIRGYATVGPCEEAVALYDAMLRSGVWPNQHTYTFVLKACAATGEVRKGRNVHGRAVKGGLDSDLFVGNALLPLYAKGGALTSARKVFDEMPAKDVVSWNSIIAGYAHSDNSQEALSLFHQMLCNDGTNKPDRLTQVSLLPVCAKLGAVREGLWIHADLIKSGVKIDVALGSGLVMFYSGCGRLYAAHLLFDRLPEKNIVAWNAMIRGYGMHGHASEAMEMFSKMLESGILPDEICFTSLLSACSHVGLVEKGWEFFDMMSKYDVKKTDLHYACMVDLLGRAGKLHEAVEFVNCMSVEPGKDVWGSLLGACRIHKNIDLAEEVFERLFLLDPHNAGRYSILIKMYEDEGRWQEAARIRLMMREKGVRKLPGYSAIEVDSVMHMFGVEDESHFMSEQIYDTLERLGIVVEEVKVETMAG